MTETDHWLPEVGSMRGLTAEEHKEPFQGERSADHDVGSMGVHLSKLIKLCAYNSCFTVCKLSPKVDF